MDIRTLGEDDLDALLALYAHLFVATNPMPTHDQAAAIWRELLAGERYRYFGGFVDGELISTCALTMVPNLTRAGQPYGLIENVVTHADYRQRGYGRAVLHAALAHAWQQGCYKVMLMTGRKDAATLRFYESAGFDGDEKQGFIAKP